MQEDHEDLKSSQCKNTAEKTALVVTSTSTKVLEIQEKPNFLKELSKNTELMNKLIHKYKK